MAKRSERQTREFEEAQNAPKFRGWLDYQSASYEIGEGFLDGRDFSSLDFDGNGLRVAEKWALELWSDAGEPYSTPDNLKVSQSLTYFVGEVYIRSFEGRWVNTRIQVDDRTGWTHMVHLPYSQRFLAPNEQLIIALSRRTGEEWSMVYQWQKEAYEAWVAIGRPPVEEP